MRSALLDPIMNKVSRNLLLPLALCGLGTAAQAQNVLLLSTAEAAAQANYFTLISSAYTKAGATVNHQAGVLSSATPVNAALFANHDIVVVASVLKPIDDAHLPVIQAAMTNRPSERTGAFVFMVDGCCDSPTLGQGGWQNTQNVTRIATMLGNATGWSLGLSRHYVSGGSQFLLNTGSPFSASFTGAAVSPSIKGHDYIALTGVPANNALYLNEGVGLPAPATTTAYTLFAPREAVNGGNGTCVMFTGDVNLFTSGSQPQQREQLAAGAKALRFSDACKLPQAITVPAQAPVPPFAANATYPLAGVTGGASNQPLQYASTTPGVCAVDANTGVVTMLAAGDCDVQITQAGNDNYTAAAPVTHRITFTAAGGAGASVTAVPTLGHWSLMLLGLAAAGMGARRLRRRP